MLAVYIGIDPGASGGIAAVTEHGAILHMAATPETPRGVLDVLRGIGATFAVIEKVWATPGMGVTSAFSFGGSYHGLLMALAAVEIPFDAVAAARWQKEMGTRQAGRKGLEKAKDKNINKRRAQELFPDRTVTHATADALLLAEYCRRIRA